MSSTKTEFQMTKVIFLQKIFRFAGRTPKDLVIINNVCKDFEETKQAHHTFNLVLYDNIIKKRKDEKDFLILSIDFLKTAPAWIVYQWTVVNENDETQRDSLKALLLYQAENKQNNILIRELELLKNEEDTSTSRELLCHILDSCIKLGIVKEVLEPSDEYNCIRQAVSRNISADCLALLIEFCARHGLNVKIMLEEKDDSGYSCIMLAVRHRLAADSMKLLFESCVQHGLDVKKMLEQKTKSEFSCILFSARYQLPVESFKFLIESCVHHGLDMKKLLEQRSEGSWNSIMLAVEYQLPFESFKFLIETCIQQGVDMKQLLEQKDYNRWSCFSLAVSGKINNNSFKLLIECCVYYGLDMKRMLEEKDHASYNSCIMRAVRSQAPFDFVKLLIDSCVQHGVDMKKILEHRNYDKNTCLSLASYVQLPMESLRLLIAHFPSNESFRTTLAVENKQQKRAVDYAKTEEIRTLLEGSRLLE